MSPVHDVRAGLGLLSTLLVWSATLGAQRRKDVHLEELRVNPKGNRQCLSRAPSQISTAVLSHWLLPPAGTSQQERDLPRSLGKISYRRLLAGVASAIQVIPSASRDVTWVTPRAAAGAVAGSVSACSSLSGWLWCHLPPHPSQVDTFH